MTLELVPIEGERILSREEKERLMRRSRSIPDNILETFSLEDEQDIKVFLTEYIVLSIEIHRDLEHEDNPEYYEEHIEVLEEKRGALFKEPTRAVERFNELLEFFPMEPWKEIKTFVDKLRHEELQHLYDTQNATGIEEALDNPFLMQQEDTLEEDHMELALKCRIASNEIQPLIQKHSLKVLVHLLIEVRKVISGDFWEDGYYDI